MVSHLKRHLWHFAKADHTLVERVISELPWETQLAKDKNPNSQVELMNQTILNIMSNFVSNLKIKIKPSQPKWFTREIKTQMRR